MFRRKESAVKRDPATTEAISRALPKGIREGIAAVWKGTGVWGFLQDGAEFTEIPSDGAEKRTAGSSSGPGIPEPTKPFLSAGEAVENSLGINRITSKEYLTPPSKQGVRGVTGCCLDSKLISLIPRWIL